MRKLFMALVLCATVNFASAQLLFPDTSETTSSKSIMFDNPKLFASAVVPVSKLKVPYKPFTAKKIVGFGFIFFSGIFDATVENALAHPDAFKENFPFYSESQWGANSWENKWARSADGELLVGKEKFWGSSRWFVGLTDGHHRWRTFDRLFLVSGVTLITLDKSNKNWWHYVANGAGAILIRSIGFTFADNWLNRGSPLRF